MRTIQVRQTAHLMSLIHGTQPMCMAWRKGISYTSRFRSKWAGSEEDWSGELGSGQHRCEWVAGGDANVELAGAQLENRSSAAIDNAMLNFFFIEINPPE